MEDETEQIFKEQLSKLPNEVSTFLSSAPWVGDLNEIGELYNLTENEMYGFKREASLVVLGLVHPDAFNAMLETEVGIKGAVLEAVVANVEKKIFAPIRPALISFFEKEAAESGESTPEATTPSAEVLPTQKEVVPETVRDITMEPRVATPVTQKKPEELAPTASMWERISGASPVNIPGIAEVSIQKEIPPVENPAPAKEWGKTIDAAPENLPIADEALPLMPPIPPKTPASEQAETPAHPFEEKMKQVFTGGQQTIVDLAIEPATPSAPAPQVSNPPPIYRADPYREPIE